jgi:hypothetical protein
MDSSDDEELSADDHLKNTVTEDVNFWLFADIYFVLLG